MNINHIESRPSKTQNEKGYAWDIFVDCDCSEDKMDTLVSKLIGEHDIITALKNESEKLNIQLILILEHAHVAVLSHAFRLIIKY